MIDVDYKLVHECKLATEVVADVNLGRVEVTYSHNALTCLSDILIKIKD